MKRSQFIKGLLATILVAPAALTISFDSIFPERRLVAQVFKINKTLKDDAIINAIIAEENSGREVAKIEAGLMDDDFIRNDFTLVVYYYA